MDIHYKKDFWGVIELELPAVDAKLGEIFHCRPSGEGDMENDWEWIYFKTPDGVHFDITRRHHFGKKPSMHYPLRFMVDTEDPIRLAAIGQKLADGFQKEILLGNWSYLRGNEFDLKPERRFFPGNV